MEKVILQSAIEITRHRDMDSLENGLLTTIANLLPTTAISIYKLLHERVENGFEEALSLTVTYDKEGNKRLVWGSQSNCLVLEKHVEVCLRCAEPVSLQIDKKHTRLLIPINDKKTLLGVIRIDGLAPLNTYQSSVEALIKIYENYLTILNESEHDKLTNLLNRRTFENKLNRLLKSQKKYQEEYDAPDKKLEKRHVIANAHAWLAMIDIDHFKQINDTYGHLFGDEVLLRLSQLMRKCFRSNDLLFRFGGEEFVIVLEPVSQHAGLDVLERFRNTVAAYEFPQLGNITISIGFEKISHHDFPDTILEYADNALYYAKENGRNQTHNYSTLVAEGCLRKSQVKSDIDLF